MRLDYLQNYFRIIVIPICFSGGNRKNDYDDANNHVINTSQYVLFYFGNIRIACLSGSRPIERQQLQFLWQWKWLNEIKMPKAGGRLYKKDGLTRYGDSHVKDKTS